MSTVPLWQGHSIRAQAAQKAGEAHAQQLASEFVQLGLPKGTHIIINTETGEYVTGTTPDEAYKNFRQRFGSAPDGWAIER